MKFNSKNIFNFVTRNIQVVGIILGVIILILGTLWFVVPQYKKVKTLGGLNYTQKQNTLASDQQYLKKLQDLRDNLNDVPQENVDRLSLILPKGKDIPGIFKQMEAFAKAVKMDLQSVAVSDGGILITPGSVQNTNQVKSLSISVVLSGYLNYQGLKTFLNTLSNQAPLLDLVNISYTQSLTPVESNYNFTFRSYYIDS